jgi:hypothetical protein
MEKKRVNYRITEADTKTAGPTKPTLLIVPDQCLSPNIPPSSIHNVAALQLVPCEPLNVLARYAGDSVCGHSTFYDVLGHDNWRAVI